MRRYATLLTALVLAGSLAGPVGAAGVTPDMQAATEKVAAAAASYLEALPKEDKSVEFTYLFAGGGTPLTNGIFFPGTTTCSNGDCTHYGPIPQVPRGTDITFVNLDEGSVSNSHRIVCLDRTKRGKPKCFSEQLDSPGESTRMITSRLKKPKVYTYLCTTHFGMYGAFEIVK